MGMLEKPTTPVPNYSEDEGIRCLQCDYNLTGLPSGRCPECGNPFNRNALLSHFGGAKAPIPIWDDRDETGFLAAFLSTIAAVCFTPRRYFRRMPSNPDRDSARKFSQSCFLATAFLGLLPILFEPRSIIGLIPAIVGWLITARIILLLLVSVLFGEIDSSGDLVPYSRDVCCWMLAAHLPVLTLAIELSLMLSVLVSSAATSVQYVLPAVPFLASAVLFMSTLIELFAKFGMKLREAALSLIMFPILVLVAGVIGIAAAGLLTGIILILAHVLGLV